MKTGIILESVMYKKTCLLQQVLKILNLVTFSEEKRLDQVLRFKSMELLLIKQIQLKIWLKLDFITWTKKINNVSFEIQRAEFI